MIKPEDYVNIISSCFLFTAGVTGNTLIIVYFLSRWKHLNKMSCYHLFIIQLAFTDIFVCISLPLSKIYDSFYGEMRNMNKVTCLWLSTIPYHVATTTSGWLLVGLSFDRYRKIIHPFKWQLNKKMVLLFTTLLWGVSYCVSLPFTLTLRYDTNSKRCLAKTLFTMIYHLGIQSVTIECLLPILSMSVLYRKSSRKLLLQSVDAQQLNRENYEHFKQRKKAVKTIKWLIVFFTLTVLPGRIVHIVRLMLLFKYKESVNQEIVSPILYFMDKYTYVNNMINVFVYCKINRNFRQYLRKKFIC